MGKKYHNPLYKSAREEAFFKNADYLKYRTEFDAFFKKDNDILGLILKCHLIVEYYLTECLRISLPGIHDLEGARLTFNQKYYLLTAWTFGFPWIRSGVQELNTIRNKMVHKIDYELTDNDLKEIYSCMDVFYKVREEPQKRGSDAIIDFTDIASMALSGWADEIHRHAPKTGSAGYNQLFNTDLKSKK